MAESAKSEPTGSFDLRELAAASAAYLVTPDDRAGWRSGRELGRWLVGEGIARPNGAVGRLELTERGAELVAAVGDLSYLRA